MEAINKVVKSIDVGSDSIVITLENGDAYYLQHHQDCCESVYLLDDGNAREIVGYKLLAIDHEEEAGDGDYESETDTTITLITDKGTIITKWVGTSNGYYSERVDIDFVAAKK